MSWRDECDEEVRLRERTLAEAAARKSVERDNEARERREQQARKLAGFAGLRRIFDAFALEFGSAEICRDVPLTGDPVHVSAGHAYVPLLEIANVVPETAKRAPEHMPIGTLAPAFLNKKAAGPAERYGAPVSGEHVLYGLAVGNWLASQGEAAGAPLPFRAGHPAVDDAAEPGAVFFEYWREQGPGEARMAGRQVDARTAMRILRLFHKGF